MKKLLLIASAIACGSAAAEEAYITPNYMLKVGDSIPIQGRQIYYLHQKCELPLVNAKDMRKYVFYRGEAGPNDVGCWATTIDDNAVSVVPKIPATSVAIAALMRVDLRKDGTAKILAMPAAVSR